MTQALGRLLTSEKLGRFSCRCTVTKGQPFLGGSVAGQPRVSTIGHLLIFGLVGAREVNGSNISHGSDFSKDKLYPLTLCVRPASACKIMSGSCNGITKLSSILMKFSLFPFYMSNKALWLHTNRRARIIRKQTPSQIFAFITRSTPIKIKNKQTALV